MLPVTVTNESIGEISWTLPIKLQEDLESLPGDFQEEIIEQLKRMLEGHSQILKAALQSGDKYPEMVGVIGRTMVGLTDEMLWILDSV